jgi:hypothetical protein
LGLDLFGEEEEKQQESKEKWDQVELSFEDRVSNSLLH